MTERTAWAVLLAVGLLTRLPLLGWFTTEMTDGVLCVTYFQWRLFDLPRFVIFPGYPALLSLFHPAAAQGLLSIETWGRLLSALFGLAVLIPLWRLGRRWASTEVVFLICLATLLSPLVWMWSLRVMTDTMFLFLFWYAVERLQAFEEAPDVKKALCVVGASLTAFLTRPEGAVLLLFAAILLLRQPRFRAWGAALLVAGIALGVASPLRPLFMNATGAFQEGSSGIEAPWVHLLANLWVVLTQPAWVFTPILFFLAVGGLFGISAIHSPLGRFWRRRLLPFLGVLVLMKVVPTNYQDRHLLLFLPAIALLAAYKLETMEVGWRLRCPEMGVLLRRNLLAAAMLGTLLVFSIAVLVLQRDSFGDLRRNAEALRALPADAVIYSDEQFKTSYLAGRPLRPWTPELRSLQVGDHLVFHTFNTPRLRFLLETLATGYELVPLRVDASFTVPLLTDLMMDKADQNRAGATAHRFEAQRFKTHLFRVARVLPPRPPQAGSRR